MPTLTSLEMCRNFSYKYSIFKKQLHTLPVTMEIMEILNVNKISRTMVHNPFAVNVPLMKEPVACFALVSCMNNTCVKVLHLYLK